MLLNKAIYCFNPAKVYKGKILEFVKDKIKFQKMNPYIKMTIIRKVGVTISLGIESSKNFNLLFMIYLKFFF